MIDHLTVHVSDYDASKAFYSKALAPLGYALVMEFGRAGGFGAGGKPDLWLAEGGPTRPALHVAIAAERRSQVDAFHEAALSAGGTDNGAPGPRPQYHKGYYGAFVLDPDGNNLEAVCHKPE
jgi:catechol 2,3-dioxygenase-like lactoylglutathione lyase family enzyme